MNPRPGDLALLDQLMSARAEIVGYLERRANVDVATDMPYLALAEAAGIFSRVNVLLLTLEIDNTHAL